MNINDLNISYDAFDQNDFEIEDLNIEELDNYQTHDDNIFYENRNNGANNLALTLK
jgi:hypothetical protein